MLARRVCFQSYQAFSCRFSTSDIIIEQDVHVVPIELKFQELLKLAVIP